MKITLKSVVLTFLILFYVVLIFAGVFTPFRIEDAQSNRSNPFNSAPFPPPPSGDSGGILNENWCKESFDMNPMSYSSSSPTGVSPPSCNGITPSWPLGSLGTLSTITPQVSIPTSSPSPSIPRVSTSSPSSSPSPKTS